MGGKKNGRKNANVEQITITGRANDDLCFSSFEPLALFNT